MGGVRKIDSEPDPAPKTKNWELAPKPVSRQNFDSGSNTVPISAMLLHICFRPYLLNLLFPKNSNPLPKNVVGLGIDPSPSLLLTRSVQELQYRIRSTGVGVFQQELEQERIFLFGTGSGAGVIFSRMFLTFRCIFAVYINCYTGVKQEQESINFV